MDKVRSKRTYEEDKNQQAFFDWLAISYPLQNELTFAIPNGGKRNLREAARLKRQGVKAGVPDIFMAIPKNIYHGLFIEMKSKCGKLSAAQKEKINLLEKQNYKVVISFSWIEAMEEVKNYLSGPSNLRGSKHKNDDPVHRRMDNLL